MAQSNINVSVDSFYSSSNMEALNQSIEQLQSGKTVSKALEELEAFSNE